MLLDVPRALLGFTSVWPRALICSCMAAGSDLLLYGYGLGFAFGWLRARMDSGTPAGSDLLWYGLRLAFTWLRAQICFGMAAGSDLLLYGCGLGVLRKLHGLLVRSASGRIEPISAAEPPRVADRCGR